MVFPDGPPAPEDPVQTQPRPRLWVWLVVGGVVMGLLLAGGVSAVARWYDSSVDTADPALATPALAALECGASAPRSDGDPDRAFALVAEAGEYPPTPYAPGADVPVRVAMLSLLDGVADVRADSEVAVVAVQDGVVVGRAAAGTIEGSDPDHPGRLRLEPGIGLTAELTYPLVACDGAPLPPGPYTLVAGVRVTPESEEARELVSAPVDVTVE